MEHSQKPLMIELFAGLHGWGEGALAEGWRVVGFDIVDMCRFIGKPKPGGDLQLVLQNVLTLHGKQFKDAALIVCSPPCQEFSYMAMPWSRAKAIEAEYLAGTRDKAKLTALFDACFRIQREACEAAGRYIPMVVENVRGAQKWVGRARWMYGSFALYGDVPALMPIAYGAQKFNHIKVPSANGRRTDVGNGARFTSRDCGIEGVKNGMDWVGSGTDCSLQRRTGSKSSARKAASAVIAKIPFALARYIAAHYKPTEAV